MLDLTLGFGLILRWEAEVDSTVAGVKPATCDHLATGEEMNSFGAVCV